MLETSNTLNTNKYKFLKFYSNKVKALTMSNQQETKLCYCLAGMRVGSSETTREKSLLKD